MRIYQSSVNSFISCQWVWYLYAVLKSSLSAQFAMFVMSERSGWPWKNRLTKRNYWTQLFNNENTIITHQHKCRHYPQWLSQRPCYTTEESVNKAGALQSTLSVPTCRMFRTFLMSPCARRIRDSFPSSSMSIWSRHWVKFRLTQNSSPFLPCRRTPALEQSAPFPMVQSGTFKDLVKSIWFPISYLVHLLCSAGMILLR